MLIRLSSPPDSNGWLISTVIVLSSPFLVMMLITPATASEPYSAEAPSLRISTRSIADKGILFRSKADTAPRVPAGPARRPFNRIRVRFAPRPRRPTVSAPVPPSVTKPTVKAAVIWLEPAAAVLVLNNSPSVFRPSCSASSTLIMSIGVSLANSSVRIREPTMEIFSTGSAPSSASS